MQLAARRAKPPRLPLYYTPATYQLRHRYTTTTSTEHKNSDVMTAPSLMLGHKQVNHHRYTCSSQPLNMSLRISR